MRLNFEFGPDSAPEVVIDWKSDVAFTPETLQRYGSQVRAYLHAMRADRGLVVMMTFGSVFTFMPANSLVT